MSLRNTHEEKIFASVLADGKIHVSVPEETEGAILREYETDADKENNRANGTSTKSGKKWEFVYTELSGMIKEIAFRDGDYGTQLMVTVGDGDEKPVVLGLGTATNFGEDLMKKIPNINLGEPVTLSPYSFEDDHGKKRKGISVVQNDKKIPNYFYDPEAKKNLHKFPEPKKAKGKKTLSKDEWKMYFTEARIFLVDYITEHFAKKESYVGSEEMAKASEEF